MLGKDSTSSCSNSSKILTGKYKLGARAGARVGKYNLGTRNSKCKFSVWASKYKLGTRAGKYKFGARARKTN